MTTDVLIIGAGISGLIAAQFLYAQGHTVQLIDKRSSVGGRLATREIGEKGLADHGAQFFTVRTDLFQDYVSRWIADDLVYVWGTGWSDGSVKQTASDGYPRYIVRGGMNSIAKRLANDLDITLDKHISVIHSDGEQWTLVDSDGDEYHGRALLMTAPMPQSLEIINASTIQLSDEDRMKLSKIRFGPCLCGIHEIDGEVELPEPGAVQNFENNVYWVADNHTKGISEPTIVTTHASTKYSRQYWEAPEYDILHELESAVKPYLRANSSIMQTYLKKWRYSIPLVTYPEDYLMADISPTLVFAGDAFGGRGRVEGALLSGVAAGHAICDALA